MTRAEYDRWWLDATDEDGEPRADLPPIVATLAAHVLALQERVDQLPDPDHPEATAWTTRCACAYDHPASVCSVHKDAA